MAIRVAAATLALMMSFQAAFAAPPETDTRTFEIRAQSVSTALKAFAAQSGLQLIFTSEDVGRATTAGVNGNLSAREALSELLAGTDLEFEFTKNEVVIVRKPKPAGENTAAVADGPSPMPDRINLAEAPESVAAPSDSAAANTGNITIGGHVTDALAASNLPGALVKILETGQDARTDDLGIFKLGGLAPGVYTLSISYLGFAEKLWRVSATADGPQIVEYPLEKSAWDVAEVTVFGTRSSRALALNQQRTAENSSSVLSADMLGNFTGTTISEALRHAQGITFARDPVTGDGTNIMVRGLSPAMNAVTLNGLNLPATYLKGQRFDRSPDISYLLADSISKITVNYSLLPSQSATGTGGLVEIETKSPLDRPPRYANFSVEGARKGHGFGEDFLASGTLSRTFGAARSFGLSASVQYRERSDRNFQYDTLLNYGPYLPLSADGTPINDLNFIDPRTRFPFEEGSDRAFPSTIINSLYDVTIKNLTTTLSAAWQPGDHTSVRLDYTRATDVRDSFSRSINMGVSMPLTLLPVAELGGEERYVYAWDRNTAGMRLVHSYNFTKGAENVTDTLAFNGSSEWNHLVLEYRLGYVRGSNEDPGSWTLYATRYDPAFGPLDPAFIDDAAIDPVEGRVLSPFGVRTGRGYPVALLTQEGYDYFNDASRYLVFPSLLEAFWGSNAGYDAKRTAALSARYTLDRGIVRYLEAGANFESSRFKTTRNDGTIYDPTCDPVCLHADDIGLAFTQPGLSAIGITQPGFNFLSRDGVVNFLGSLPALSRGPAPAFSRFLSQIDPRALREYTDEDNLAAFAQARVDIGKLEIVGGARMTRADVANGTLSLPGVILADGSQDEAFTRKFSRLVTMSGTATDILPRVGLNFRQTDNLVFRGSYYLTVARPSLQDLSAEQSLYLDFSYIDPATGKGTPLLSISQGTPGLKPTKTDNYDLSVEYYHDQLGLMRLSGFYKLSKHLLESNTSRSFEGIGADTPLPDHPYFQNLPDDLIVQRTQPGNSPDSAYIWGVEAGIERQLAFLPGIWSGFGVYANVTYTDSSMVQTAYWEIPPVFDADGNLVTPGRAERLEIEGQPYQQQSPLSGTASITYNKYGIDASLSYSYQARSRALFEPYNLRRFTESFDTLDLRIARQFATGLGKYTAFFEAADLLKGPRDSDLETSVGGGQSPKFYTSGGFIGGRMLRLGISGSF